MNPLLRTLIKTINCLAKLQNRECNFKYLLLFIIKTLAFFLYINRRIKISPLKRDIKAISHISHFYVSIKITSRELCLWTVEVIKDPPRRYTRTSEISLHGVPDIAEVRRISFMFSDGDVRPNFDVLGR